MLWGLKMFESYSTASIEFALGEQVSNEGKNSEVFLIKDKHLSATLVAKRIPREKFTDLEKYFAECRISYLSRHTNVVPMHYACYDATHVFIVMPFYKNGSLKRAIDAKFLTVTEIIRYATQFLSGLNNIHAHGHVHFDIKPDNILLSDRQEAMIADFGLSAPTNTDGHATTPHFYGPHATPELITDEALTRRSDIYGVGLTLYRMCNGNDHFNLQLQEFVDEAGELLVDGFANAVMSGEFPNRSDYLPHIPQTMRNTITKCLSIDPKDRYNSVIEIINALAGIGDTDLDWQFEKIDSGHGWSKTVGDTHYSLFIHPNGTSEARKRTSKADHRISSHCLSTINTSSIKKFLGTY